MEMTFDAHIHDAVCIIVEKAHDKPLLRIYVVDKDDRKECVMRAWGDVVSPTVILSDEPASEHE